MLAHMSHGQFNERLAAYMVDPWGGEMATLSAIGAALVNTLLAVNVPKDSEVGWLNADHFLPKREQDQPEEKEDPLARSLRVMRAQAGV